MRKTVIFLVCGIVGVFCCGGLGASHASVVLDPGDRFFTAVDSTHIGECSVGAPARDRSGAYGFVTAGHCFPGGRDSGVYVLRHGVMKRIGFFSWVIANPSATSTSDAAFVQLYPGTIVTHNLMSRILPIDGVVEHTIKRGVEVCKVGTTTARTCGRIVSDDRKTIVVTPESAKFADHGDSGCPVFIFDPMSLHSTYVGLVISKIGRQVLVVSMPWVEKKLHVKIL